MRLVLLAVVCLALSTLATATEVAWQRPKDFTARGASCYSAGDPHYKTFDNRYYDWYGVGEYVLYKNDHDKEEVHITTGKHDDRSHVSFTTGVAVRSSGHLVSFRFVHPRAGLTPQLIVDGRHRRLHARTIHVGDLRVVFGGIVNGGQAIHITNTRTGTVVFAHIYTGWSAMRFMNVFMNVAGFSRSNPTLGMCGVFDGVLGNDYRLRNGQTTNNPGVLVASWQVAAGDTFFEGFSHHRIITAEAARRESARERHGILKELANGDAALVAKAKQSCSHLHHHVHEETLRLRHNCAVDYLSGLRRRAVAEARNIAADARLPKWISNTRSCVSWGDPHYVTFDGRSYDFQNVGEYIFYKNTDLNEESHLFLDKPRPSSPVSFTTGVSFRAGRNRASLMLERPQGGRFEPVLRVNGKRVNIVNGAKSTHGRLEVNIAQVRPGAHALTFRNRITGTEVTSHTHLWAGQIGYMDARVHARGYFDKGPGSRGLCGKFDGNNNNDFTDRQGRLQSNPIAFAQSYLVDSEKSHFRDAPAVTPLTVAQVEQNNEKTPLQLARGNQDLVDKAQAACQAVQAVTRNSCVKDFIEGGGKDTVADAGRIARRVKPDFRFRARLHPTRVPQYFRTCTRILRSCKNFNPKTNPKCATCRNFKRLIRKLVRRTPRGRIVKRCRRVKNQCHVVGPQAATPLCRKHKSRCITVRNVFDFCRRSRKNCRTAAGRRKFGADACKTCRRLRGRGGKRGKRSCKRASRRLKKAKRRYNKCKKAATLAARNSCRKARGKRVRRARKALKRCRRSRRGSRRGGKRSSKRSRALRRRIRVCTSRLCRNPKTAASAPQCKNCDKARRFTERCMAIRNRCTRRRMRGNRKLRRQCRSCRSALRPSLFARCLCCSGACARRGARKRMNRSGRRLCTRCDSLRARCKAAEAKCQSGDLSFKAKRFCTRCSILARPRWV